MTENAITLDTNFDLPWWETNDVLIRRTNKCISGNPDMTWIDYSLSKHLLNRLPMEECLIFGCGRGDIERKLAINNAFNRCDGYEDTGEREVRVAIDKARELNLQQVTYHIVDMNHLTLPKSRYESIWVNGALHHIENLEYVFHQIKQSLKSNGLFFINDYVGPSRFQFSIEQKEIINHCLMLLPTELRTIPYSRLKEITRRPNGKGIGWFLNRLISKIHERDLLKTIQRRYWVFKQINKEQPLIASEVNFPTLQDVISYDPTMAIRSSEIINSLKKEFEIIEKKDWGGNILNYLLKDISHHFFEGNKISYLYLDLLIAIEDTLLQTNRIDSDFSYLVARPIEERA